MATRVFGPLSVLALFLLTDMATASRLIEDWPYEKLFQKADIVIIAKPVNTERANDQSPRNAWDLGLIAQNTTFKTMHVLKGQVDGERIRVLHFKIGKVPPQGITNGPLLMKFDSKKWAPWDYILFLKRLKDGRYEAVSGQIDPVLSIRLMATPIPMGNDIEAPK